MNILIYTNIVPFPLDEGGKVAQYVFLESLIKNGHQVTMVSTGSLAQNNNLYELKNRLPQLSTKFITENIDKKKRSFLQKAFGILAWELGKRIKDDEANLILKNDFFMVPIKTKTESFAIEWNRIIEEVKPEIIQVDFIDNAAIALLIPPGIKKVIILHDLRFASVKQAAQLAKLDSLYIDYLANYVKIFETAYLNLYDALITFSNEDAFQLSDKIPSSKIYLSPFSVLNDRYVNIEEQNNTINKLVFIGPDHHYPNFDALLWYAEEMGQKVYEQFGFKLTVIGKWSENRRKRFKDIPFIEFIGFAEDINKAMENALLLVPLRLGSGIRTKIIEAFAMGVPVVSSGIGCEGLPVKNEEGLLIADTPNDFIQSIGKLIRDEELQKKVRRQAQKIAKANYSQSHNYDTRISIYQGLVS